MPSLNNLVSHRRRTAAAAAARTGPVEEIAEPPAAQPEPEPERRSFVLPGALAIVAVLLGGSAAWSWKEAAELRGAPSAGNTALTDTARTSEVKGKVTDELNTLFSYDYTDPGRTDEAARKTLTGKAVQQYDTMLAGVRREAPRQKLVLTTTITHSAVELLQGGRARLLVFGDQRDTRATTKETTYAAAMFAVDVIRQDGTWKITNIDTLGVAR